LNVKVSAHNVLVIGGTAVLVILILKQLSRTGIARLPLVGDVVRLGATA
jgi:hypothetical protein